MFGEMESTKQKITAVIVDDELQGIRSLKNIIEQHCPELEIVHTFQSSMEALKEIPKLSVDLLFFDIRMPQLNGLELHELLGFEKYRIIYTTASNDKDDIIKALQFNAIDYLLKPIVTEKLIAAIERAKEESYKIQSSKAMDDWKNGISQNSRFGIKEGNKLIFEALSNIVYCQSDGNFTKVILQEGNSIYSSYPLVEMEERLRGPFIRIHREYLINKEHIAELEGSSVMMTNKKYLPISRKRKKEVGELLNQ